MAWRQLQCDGAILRILLAAAIVLGIGASPLHAAEEAVTLKDVLELKEKLKRLERRLEAQEHRTREQRVLVRTEAAPGSRLKDQIETAVVSNRVWPSSFGFKGVTITPGGFIALDSFYRTRALGADISTPYNSIPFNNLRSGHTAEFRESSRLSRLSLLLQGDITPTTHLGAFIDSDFLSATQTANLNQTNSFTPRLRNAYATVDDDDYGIHLLAGQAWSLLTPNAKGIIPQNLSLPPVIESQYLPGFFYARQPQIRVVKDFGREFWFGVSLENPATTFFAGPGGVAALPSSLVFNEVPTQSFDTANVLSLNHIPDVLGKAAWDHELRGHAVHLEGFGLFRAFYDRVNSGNQNVYGGGFGGSLRVEVLPKLLDVTGTAITGRGIARYGSAGLVDATFNPSGRIVPIPQTGFTAGAVLHPAPWLDVYGYVGAEAQRATFSFGPTGTLFGYGNPLATNTGCNIEGSAAATCVGNTRLIRQGTVGFWDRIYDGAYGRLQAGLQYQYTQRFAFAGLGGAPKTDENAVFASLRYFPF